MKRILFLAAVSVMLATFVNAQTVSIRVVQSSFDSSDPDGAGPATGSVVLRFELMSSAPVQGDGVGLSTAFQSTFLMESPSPNITRLGPLLAIPDWTQGATNLPGNVISPSANYGGKAFDRRMIVSFNQPAGGTSTLNLTNVWSPIFEITYYTKGTMIPEGGYTVPEPGSIVAQNELSADGGLTTYPFDSPNLNSPTPLGSAIVLPVLFTKFNAQCNGNGTLISWATAQEGNSNKFEIERSIDGRNWSSIASVAAAGNSATERNYQQLDLGGGKALYRIKQTDKDGSFIYTNTESVNCTIRNITSVIYPVPAKDVLNVVIKSDRALRTQLMVFDIAGKLMKKLDAQVTSGNNNFKIDLTGLTAGDYIIKSSDAAVELNKVFTITR